MLESREAWFSKRAALLLCVALCGAAHNVFSQAGGTNSPGKPRPAPPAQVLAEETLSLDELAGHIQDWATENLDENLLQALGEVDTAKVESLFGDLERQLRGDYVIDLAQLRQTAQAVLPLLRKHPETAPVASWLAAEMDYLDVAEDFRAKTPVAKPGTPAPPKANPTPKEQREVWIKRVSEQPWPPAAKSYVPILKPVFAAQKLPRELVWIAEVESAFDPSARSPVGATGLFQLMPDTARQYGLRINPFDQRKNPQKNAQAAAKHLDYLYRKFKDWRLTLAAFNAGEGTVGRLLQKHRAKTYDEIATRLPAETQMYVPRIEAVLLKREGARLASLPSPG